LFRAALGGLLAAATVSATWPAKAIAYRTPAGTLKDNRLV